MANTNYILDLRHLTSLSMDDINSDNSDSGQAGMLSFTYDRLGMKTFQKVRNNNGSTVVVGELLSRPANVAVSDITSGTTTTIVTTGLTADVHEGKIIYCVDNNDSAGAAPEGETSVVDRKNSTTTLTMDSGMAFSAACAANDDFVLISTWQAEDAADGDNALDVLGVVAGKDGIQDGRYGWVCREGVIPALMKASSAITAPGDPVVADTARCGAFGGDGQELWVGQVLASVGSDSSTVSAPVNVKLMTAGGIQSP